MNADTMMGTELSELRRRRPEVAGTVLAGTDGLLISSDLPTTDATHLAALAAASFGLGHRVADTVRHGEFRESVVRTSTGAVVTYPAGRNALLTLVADASADLDELHADARAVARRTGSVLDTSRLIGAATVPEAHARLSARTSGGRLPRRVTPHTWRRPPV
ncbi:roadblock/LC7 domain-containing protein [Micromonospora sp. DSM 115977]|uniref:Roadblock/LC7 domain-containing protein n=1 Tax=Micromonospora reichwaldensis TaxID=3075516 RepID=A0ABU2WW14_9ACTN|nr:roadblock/LC7 domain-containing protein [Micromonospora sp. DSM 115977]MDT0529730.1 roadblock/LC7 domain-containing protein [Micromonospora sp. DSM 115977]